MAFDSWAICELMGHSRIAGKVTEEVVFGTPMMRVDVPKTERREGFTKYYNSTAIYSLTPVDEKTALAATERFDEVPHQPFLISSAPALSANNPFSGDNGYYDPDRDDDGYGDYPDDDEDEWDDDYDPMYDPEEVIDENLKNQVRSDDDLPEIPF